MNDGLIYFQDGHVVAKSGEVGVYRMNKELFLEIGPGHNLWTLESEYSDYIEQLEDKPKGDCLEIGLGLGVASRCILTYPQVKHLTTVEKNKDVIQTHGQISPLLDESAKLGRWAPYDADRHTILNADGMLYMYKTQKRFDFIFLDFYQEIDEESLPLIADMVKACRKVLKRKGSIVGWLDPYTEEEDAYKFKRLFK